MGKRGGWIGFYRKEQREWSRTWAEWQNFFGTKDTEFTKIARALVVLSLEQ
jgi:hypothetical protein